ncbi:hypothetical protein GCK72_022063 [Caenorhabditis remanei]|uniref:Uncharacterized protein n=1 Tax=Caenorhabditis remanei TaxID=31234 RepID=A0A6A5FT00_CAERE|nr:hypothetical protein GCK72_022063 [Caenorhabditis remanei]KAF1745616.1 hypothetical protein GCK72_022063 [Caenorhabditis remanei]
MIRLSTVLVLLLLSSDVLGYSSPLVTKPGRVIRKSIIDHIRFFGNITCKYATDPSINFLELWERDSMNPDDHLSQTVVLDQTIYPYKYDIHAIDDGDEWGSNNYSFYLWAEHNCTFNRRTITRKVAGTVRRVGDT